VEQYSRRLMAILLSFPMARERKQRRERERALRKTVRQIEKLAVALPGGSADHPIDVTSASVVEVQARGTPCPQCAGELELLRERATSTARGVLRELELACRRCHAPRTLWFRVRVAAPS
jgi:hypothetical protein